MILAPPDPGIVIRGAPRELFRLARQWQAGADHAIHEVIIDGPGGTGKSTGLCAFFWWMLHEFPGCRMLFVRKTRKSLSQSFLVTWERVIGESLAPGHPAIVGASRSHRESYTIGNGSEVVLGGLDTPSKWFSTDFDVIFCNELFELNERDEWQDFKRGLRNWAGGLKFQLLIGDTNPREDTHWILNRFTTEKAIRLQSRHEDNPDLFDRFGVASQKGRAYLANLDELVGPSYKRLRLGLWCAAEGQVWETFDREKHMLMPVEDPIKAFNIKRVIAGMDWGWTDAGALEVWGFDDKRRGHLLVQVKRTRESIAWWIERLCDVCAEFDIEACVADSADPGAITLANQIVAERVSRRTRMDPELPFVRPANKRRWTTSAGTKDMGGIDRVRTAMHEGRFLIVRDSLRWGPDESLKNASRPTCLEDEIGAYIYATDKATGKLKKDITDPACSDDLCDTARYVFMYEAETSPVPSAYNAPLFREGSAGEILGHEGVMFPKTKGWPL